MAHSIIHLYVHFNISVIRLVVITQAISHSVGSWESFQKLVHVPN